LHEIRDLEGEVYFACGSSCYSISGVWEQSTGCGEILDLQRRLAEALAALTAIERHEAGSDLGFEIVSDHGEWVLFEDLRPVVDILEGNSPTNLEGSS
jgi:hypothetical protein